VLLLVFVYGLKNLYTVKNLGFMVFFVVYTAYEWLYRKTGVILILFTSFFIVAQYYFSLHYRIFAEDKYLRQQFKFYTIFRKDSTDPFGTEGKESMYFRLTPQPFDWVILLLMSVLNNIN
jgi:hypothetical protein